MSDITFSPWPSYSQDEIDAVVRVLHSNKVNYWTGDECRAFESEFAQWCGCDYAVTLANGTVALDLALKGLNIGAGDEVIVTPRTFIASVSCVVNAGATPVFADVDENTQNITIETISSLVNSRTRAIICVHISGWPCDMDSIMQFANIHGLYVIEDCAQAHGARYKGRSVGSIGHIGTWSFCQDKIMTTGGEGGMLTTNDKTLWSKIWALKDHGKSWDAIKDSQSSNAFSWVHESFGYNGRMTEMQAAIGRIQLTRMSIWHAKRVANAQKFVNMLSECSSLRIPLPDESIDHAWYKFTVFIRPECLADTWDRNRIMNNINEMGTPCRFGPCSEVYLEKAFDGTGIRPKERLKIARKLGETSLMFFVHPTLAENEIEEMANMVLSVMSKAETS